MKCPKCGFTSFDYLQECKKCGSELSEFKSRFNLRSIIFPVASASVVPSAGINADEEPVVTSEPTNFGIDFMDEGSAAETSESMDLQASAEPFDLGEDESSEGGEETKTWFLDPDASEIGSLDVTDDEDGPAESEPNEDGEDEERSEEFLKLEFETSWEEDLSGEEALDETSEGTETLDLPSFEDLPSLDEPDEEDSAIADLEETDLSSWDFDEPEEDARRSSGGEEPTDPFDDRESAPVERVPENAESDTDSLQESGLEPMGEEEELAGPTSQDSGIVDSEVAPEVDDFEPATEEKVEKLALPRLAASSIDLILLGGVFSLFVAAGELAMNPGPKRLWPTGQMLFELAIPYFLVLFGLFFGYFTLFHYLTGQTVGKMVLGLRVEGQHGEPLVFSQAFLRSAGGLLSLLSAGAGFVWIALDGQGRGWSDRLAGTRVARKEGPDPCEEDLAAHLA